MSLFSILVDVAAKTANFESGMDRVDKRLQSFGETVERIKKIAEAGLFVEAVKSTAEFTKQILEQGDQLNTLAKRAGTASQAFSELAYGAKLSGVAQEDLSKALTQMNRSLSLAATGSKQQNDALAALGLTAKDFIGLDTDKKFELIADRISQLKDEGDKARAEMTLFGRAGGELGALFEKGAAGIRAAREEAQRVGQSFTATQLRSLEEANKSINRLSASWKSFETTLVAEVAPALTLIFDRITQIGNSNWSDKIVAGMKAAQLLNPFTAPFAAPMLLAGPSHLPRVTEQGVNSGHGAIGRPTAAPGFVTDITPFNVTQMKTVGSSRGINPVLDQWDRETKASLDSVYEEYRTFKAKTQNLLDENVIDPAEYAKRMEEAWGKFENAAYISPVVISQRAKSLARYLTEAQAQTHEFVSDFKSSLQSAFDQGGAVGKNLVRNLITAFGNRALFQAIASIGDALSNALNAKAVAGGFGGVLGEIFRALYGGTDEIAPAGVTSFRVPTYATGTSYVPRTGLALLHKGESVNTAEETARGGTGGITMHNYYDLRGSTPDVMAALPAVLDRRDAALKADILGGIQRKKYPISR